MTVGQAKGTLNMGIPVWKVMWSVIHFRPWHYVFYSLVAVAGALIWLIPALAVREFMNLITGGAEARFDFWTLIALLVTGAVLRMASSLGGARMGTFFVLHICAWLHRNVLERILQRPGALPLPESPGEVISRFRGDTGELPEFARWLSELLSLGLLASIALIVMLTVNPVITLAALSPLVLVAVIARSTASRVEAYRRAARKIRKLRELEALGAEVLVARADVTDPAQMREVVAQALDRFSALNGVIHAAGVPGGGVMQIKTREEAEGVMSPKVRGTLVLDAILKDVELDFVVLCSSVNAIVGRMGQVDYCAANAFLDAFVHRNRSGEEVPTICITWDTWREVGMAARMLERSPETAASQPREVAHPLLDRCIVERDDLRVYSTTFRVPEHWMLHEHGIMGKPTLPGTTYLEMARAAFDDCVGGDRVEIRDVYFSMPLVLENDEEREARVVLRRVGDAFEFSVVSCLSAQEDAWLEHAKGTIVATAAEPPRRRAIAEVEGRCDQQEIVDPLAQTRLGHFEIRRCAVPRGITSQGEPLSVDSIVITELDGGSRARSMEFGPRWQGLQRVKLGANEGVALIELPAAFEQDFQFYQLHPALLDFSTSFLRLFKSQGSYLPLSYKRLRMIGSLPGRVYSHVRSIDDDTSPGVTRRFDVTIMDEQGTELVAIEEFAVAKVGDADRLSVLSGARPLSALIPPVGSKPRGGGVRTRMLEEDLSEGLSPAQGVDVFDRVMHSALTRVVVSARDLLARIAQSRARSERLFAEGLEAMSQRLKHPRPKLMTPYAAPRDEIEQKLAEIWQDVLGVEQVGVHDSFFDLGGDSLLITRIHSRFRRGFEHDMSVASMLQYPTIADLAQALGEQTDGGEQLKIEQVQDRTGRQKAAMRRRREKMMKKAA
jgi:polyketide synthase PksJ